MNRIPPENLRCAMKVAPGIPKTYDAVVEFEPDEFELFSSGENTLDLREIMPNGTVIVPVWGFVIGRHQPIDVIMQVTDAEKLGIGNVEEFTEWVRNRVQEQIDKARA